MTERCDLQVTDYRILFDDNRYPASSQSVRFVRVEFIIVRRV